MGGQVVADNVWIDGVLVEKGTRRQDVPAAIVGAIGSHLWVEEGDRPNISASGDALTGLTDNVWVDGVMYQKGTVPPREAWGKIGLHLWVAGGQPPEPALAEEPAPDAGPSAAAPEPSGEPVDLPALAEPEPEPAEESDLSDAEDGDAEPTPAAVASPAPVKAPNRSGQGSSLTAWQAFAVANNVDVHAEAERHEVIEACEKAGLIPAK
jgi:hypothetical protein